MHPLAVEATLHLAEELMLCKSIDCILIKLDSTVYLIKDRAPDEHTAREVFKEVLRDQRVRRYLERLACYKDTVEKELENPRFRILASMRDVLVSILRETRCSGEESLEQVARPATWRIEYAEKMETIPEKTSRIRLPRLRGPRLSEQAKALIIVVVGTAIIILLKLLLH